jgi:hypothetical protein
MIGLSTLATIISVFSFPLVFVALIYPQFTSARGRWFGVCVYGGISIGMMLVAVVTSPDPHGTNQEWTWIDWLVVASGCGFFLVFIARKYSHLKKQVLVKRETVGKKKDGRLEKKSQGRRKRSP